MSKNSDIKGENSVKQEMPNQLLQQAETIIIAKISGEIIREGFNSLFNAQVAEKACDLSLKHIIQDIMTQIYSDISLMPQKELQIPSQGFNQGSRQEHSQ